MADAVVEILRRNGLETIIPEQVCCGLPMISNALYADARNKARTNIDVLAGYARQGYRIIGTSTSCTHTIKAEYGEMLDIHDDDATLVANATWDICEFLLDLHEHGRLNTRFGRLDEDLPYHAPCQLRSHGIGLPAMDLFALVPGLRAADMDHDCCGIAGTYGMKKEKYPIGMAVGAPLFEKIRASRSSRGRLRLGDVSLADREGDRDPHAASDRDPPPGIPTRGRAGRDRERAARARRHLSDVAGIEGGSAPVPDARPEAAELEAVDVRLGGLAFLVNRAAGLGLVAYLYMHLLILSMLVRGPDAWDNFVDLASSPPFLALDVLLLAGLLVHAANGIRVVLIGLGLVARGQRARLTAAPPLAGQMVSGAALLVLLTLHLVAQHLVVPTGLRYAEDVVGGLRSPAMLVMEIAVLAFVAYHALAGVRVVLVDIGFSVRTEERIARILWIVWIGTVVYGVALFAAILAAA